MNQSTAMIAPVVVLALWSHVMWIWMYATRIPAISRSGMRLDRHAPRGQQMATLPSRVRWKSDNYTNLMEQPTVFYAVALSLALLGDASAFSVGLAWLYVGLRVVHSAFQATVNRIPIRFYLFASSGLTLIVLTLRAVYALL
ncbi:MAG: MAPEG family protein [Myxococcota bacterium]